MARVAVVGAGPGGLAVAARLGAKGHAVTVFERHDRVGGKLHTWRRDGYAFDTGPSLFTLPAVYRDLFLKTGHPLEHEVDLVETEPGFRYGFADGSVLALPGSSAGRTSGAIREQFGAAASEEWRTLMGRAADIWRLTRSDVLGTALTGPRQLLGLARPRDLRTVAPWRSLHATGRASLSDPRLRMVLDRYATYSGSQPTKAPGALVTIPFVEQTFGLWHLGGGLGTLADALRRRGEKAGVTFRLGAGVRSISHDGQRVTGVVTDDGERVAADLVVSDVDARLLPAMLGRATRSVRDPSYSAFAIMLAVAGRTPELHHHNVWFPADYAREFADLAAGRPVRDPAVYLCRPDDPAMAPAGDESWFVLVNAPRHGTGRSAHRWNRHLADEYAEHVIATLERRSGLDLRGRIRWRAVQSPADLGTLDGTGDGAIYGSASHGALSVLRRARNTGELAGLYLVGGTAHPGGGLPLVGMGAEIVANLIGRAASPRAGRRGR